MRVYISEKALSKKPEECSRCPMCDAEYDDCVLSPVSYKEWDEQYKNCPLIEKYQPNPFDSVVQLLLDFDLGSEWGGDVRELAQYICDMFKDGAYD